MISVFSIFISLEFTVYIDVGAMSSSSGNATLGAIISLYSNNDPRIEGSNDKVIRKRII